MKKVRFSSHVTVHMVEWDNSRKGIWMEMACDRMRFQRRTDTLAVILDPILTPEHRRKVLHRTPQLVCAR